MAKNDLADLESSLYRYVDEHRKISEDLAKEVNARNLSRIEEKKADERASYLRKKIIIAGVFVVGALVAYFYYKAAFGMF